MREIVNEAAKPVDNRIINVHTVPQTANIARQANRTAALWRCAVGERAADASFATFECLAKGQYAHVVLAMDQSTQRAARSQVFAVLGTRVAAARHRERKFRLGAKRAARPKLRAQFTSTSHRDHRIRIDSAHRSSALVNELAALRATADVERCVHLHDVVATHNKTYLVTSFIAASSTLESHLLAVGAMSECDARRLFAPLVRTIGQIHERGWVHHDLSLQNVLVSPDLTPHVIDFGLAQPNSDSLLSFGATPYFSSPELLLRLEHSGVPVDVWALGVILFAMVCGAMPFPAKSLRELRDIVMRRDTEPLAFLPRISLELRSLISAMLTFEPTDRATIADVLAHPWLQQQDQLQEISV
jgi:serine/threonine protein kinase